MRDRSSVRKNARKEETALRNEKKHEQETLRLIVSITKRHDQQEEAKTISYAELARILNEELAHKTLYGKYWRNASVKRVIGRSSNNGNYRRIGHEGDKQKAANDKRARMLDKYALVFREKYLPLIDTSQNLFAISKDLNRLRVPTRKEYEEGAERGRGKWGGV